MNILRSALAGLALFGLSAAANAAPGDLVVHARDAGTLDASGYTPVTTKVGGLRFDMPCKYNEFSFADAPKENNKSPYANTAIVVLCSRGESQDISAIATMTGYDTGGAGADHFFKQQEADDTKAGAVELTTYKGSKALISAVHREGRCQWKLLVRRGDNLFAMNYFIVAPDCATVRKAAERFLFSLEFAA